MQFGATFVIPTTLTRALGELLNFLDNLKRLSVIDTRSELDSGKPTIRDRRGGLMET